MFQMKWRNQFALADSECSGSVLPQRRRMVFASERSSTRERLGPGLASP